MATLTLQLSESLTLNGREEGSIKTVSYAGINEIFKRTVTIAAGTHATPQEVVTFTATPAAATAYTLDQDHVVYIRVTNLSSNTLGLILNGATTAIAFSLGGGQSQVFNNGLMQGDDTVDSIDAVPSIKIESIEVTGDSGNTSDIELFVGLS
jgi:hypothetical protein